MTLKPVTVRLDAEEYEKLQQHLQRFGDPDINVAYVLRCYIRDLNRALPVLEKSRWDLKNYFAFLRVLLKQFGAMADVDLFSQGLFDWTRYWKQAMGLSVPGQSPEASAPEATQSSQARPKRAGRGRPGKAAGREGMKRST